MFGKASDVGIQTDVLPPVIKGRYCFVRNSGAASVECIDERLALGCIEKVLIEDIKAVLHFAVVGHAVGVAQPESLRPDDVKGSFGTRVVDESTLRRALVHGLHS